MIMPIMLARARLRNLFTGGVLVFLGISAYTLHSHHLAPITASLTTRAEGVSLAEIEPSNPGWCSVDDIVHGHWVESAPIESIEELQQKFFHTYNRRMRCDPIQVQPNQTDQEAMHQRAMRIASPTFLPRGECLVRQTPWRDMIKMLLRMPAGVTIIGDSMAQQLTGTFENMLLQPDGLVKDHSNSTWDRIIFLNPTHAETYQLLEEAGVSENRLRVPLVTHWRSHHLGNETDLNAAFGSVKGYKREPYEPVEWFEMFHEHLKTMYDGPGSEGLFTRDDVRREDSVIIMQTGPHWTEHELGHGMSNEDALVGFKNMVELTETRLRALPYPINILWQTIAAPHIDCLASTDFDNERKDISSPLDINKPAPHNHDRMELMNDHLRSRFSSTRAQAQLTSSSPARTTAPWLPGMLLPKIGFWPRSTTTSTTNPQTDPISSSNSDSVSEVRLADFWPLSVKRPDAHTVPHKGDCLHFCETGVPDEWFKLSWHMIMENEKNRDYEYRGLPASD